MSKHPLCHGRDQPYKKDKCQGLVAWRDGIHHHQCQRNPQEDSEFCWQHQPERMEKSRQAMIDRRIANLRKQVIR